MKANLFSALNGSGLRIAVIASRFNQDLTDALLADCLNALQEAHVRAEDITTIRTPGSFELPVAAAMLTAQGTYDAIVCLGVIIKGDTHHDHYIAEAVANGLIRISIEQHLPVIFGVLTTEDKSQAEARALGSHKKGWEAGMSAVEMALLMKKIQHRRE